jgi:hypothetical protein
MPFAALFKLIDLLSLSLSTTLNLSLSLSRHHYLMITELNEAIADSPLNTLISATTLLFNSQFKLCTNSYIRMTHQYLTIYICKDRFREVSKKRSLSAWLLDCLYPATTISRSYIDITYIHVNGLPLLCLINLFTLSHLIIFIYIYMYVIHKS